MSEVRWRFLGSVDRDWTISDFDPENLIQTIDSLLEHELKQGLLNSKPETIVSKARKYGLRARVPELSELPEQVLAIFPKFEGPREENWEKQEQYIILWRCFFIIETYWVHYSVPEDELYYSAQVYMLDIPLGIDLFGCL